MLKQLTSLVKSDAIASAFDGLPADFPNSGCVGHIGQEGIWAVYDAIDRTSKQPVSLFVADLKSLYDRLGLATQTLTVMIQRLQQGVQWLSRLRHPGVLRVASTITHDTAKKRLFFATEPILGSLASLLASLNRRSDEILTMESRQRTQLGGASSSSSAANRPTFADNVDETFGFQTTAGGTAATAVAAIAVVPNAPSSTMNAANNASFTTSHLNPLSTVANSFTPLDALIELRRMADTLQFLHNQARVANLNINPCGIAVARDGQAWKLFDFCFAATYDDLNAIPATFCDAFRQVMISASTTSSSSLTSFSQPLMVNPIVAPSLDYAAPEYALDNHPVFESDMFSFGVVMANVLCAAEAFAPLRDTSLSAGQRIQSAKAALESVGLPTKSANDLSLYYRRRRGGAVAAGGVAVAPSSSSIVASAMQLSHRTGGGSGHATHNSSSHRPSGGSGGAAAAAESLDDIFASYAPSSGRGAASNPSTAVGHHPPPRGGPSAATTAAAADFSIFDSWPTSSSSTSEAAPSPPSRHDSSRPTAMHHATDSTQASAQPLSGPSSSQSSPSVAAFPSWINDVRRLMAPDPQQRMPWTELINGELSTLNHGAVVVLSQLRQLTVLDAKSKLETCFALYNIISDLSIDTVIHRVIPVLRTELAEPRMHRFLAPLFLRVLPRCRGRAPAAAALQPVATGGANSHSNSAIHRDAATAAAMTTAGKPTTTAPTTTTLPTAAQAELFECLREPLLHLLSSRDAAVMEIMLGDGFSDDALMVRMPALESATLDLIDAALRHVTALYTNGGGAGGNYGSGESTSVGGGGASIGFPSGDFVKKCLPWVPVLAPVTRFDAAKRLVDLVQAMVASTAPSAAGGALMGATSGPIPLADVMKAVVTAVSFEDPSRASQLLPLLVTILNELLVMLTGPPGRTAALGLSDGIFGDCALALSTVARVAGAREVGVKAIPALSAAMVAPNLGRAAVTQFADTIRSLVAFIESRQRASS